APDVRVVGRPLVRFEILLEVERLTRLELDVTIVREKLPDRSERTRPFARPEQEIEPLSPAGVRSLRPHEDLRHEQDRPDAVLALEVEERPDELVAFLQPSSTRCACRDV